MKKTIIPKIIKTLAVGLLLSACGKEGIMLYKEAPGIYFNSNATTYSFVENVRNLELGCDTVNIPVLVTGSAVDFERVVDMAVATEDTLLTAESSMYDILGGSIAPGEYSGVIKVQINYIPALDDSVYVACFKLNATKDFPVTDLNQTHFLLSITNKLTQPANWSRLQPTFGNYSNSWYKFILETTGLSSIPYWNSLGSADPANPDPERWTMTYNELKAWAAMVKVALTDYNNQHPGNPLRHEDGEYVGQVVSMP